MAELDLFDVAYRCSVSGEGLDPYRRRHRERQGARLFWTACGIRRPHRDPAEALKRPPRP